MCMYLISNTCQVPWQPRGLQVDTQALVLHWGWGFFPGTLSAPMWPLAHVVLFKYVAIVLNQCITKTAGNSPGQLLWGVKVRTWSFNKQGRLVHFTGATWEEPCAFSEDFRASFSPGNSSEKNSGTPNFPHTVYLKMQMSVRTGRVARRCWRAASPGDVLREASRLLPVFEGTNHVYTMTYLQQTVSFGILVLLKLCP